MTPRRRRLLIVLAALTVLGAVAALVVNAMRSNLVFFYTPTQVAAHEAPQGRSISDFLVAAALKEAHRAIEAAQIIRLSVDDQQRFAELLFNPPPLAPRRCRSGP